MKARPASSKKSAQRKTVAHKIVARKSSGRKAAAPKPTAHKSPRIKATRPKTALHAVAPHKAASHVAAPPRKAVHVKVDELQNRLREAEETLDAIRNGEVDALVVAGPNGEQVYSLQGAEHPYRLFVEQMQEGAVTLDKAGIILYCNQRFAEILDMPLENIIGTGIERFFREADRDTFHDLIVAARTAPTKTELFLQRPSGSAVPAYLSLAALPVDTPGSVSIVVTDLTDRHALRDADAARNAAEAASRAKDLFLAALSHELRTPLSPALLTASMMKNDPLLPRHLRESADMIQRNIQLEARLIDDLLDISRIVTGKLQIEPQLVELHSLLDEALSASDVEIASHGLQLHRRLDAASDRIQADPGRCRQIFFNLINNAIKFTPRGGVITITTSNPTPSRLRVEVADNGAGIESNLLPLLFNSFQQGNNGKSRGGLGLGLAICKGIADLHSATLSASSPGSGLGANFTIEFDLAATSEQPRPLRTPSFLKAPAAEVAPLTILLVEDHEDTARAMSKLLTKAGHTVHIAQTAAAALQMSSTITFDAIISDLGLPDGSGVELMRSIRKTNQLPAIALTGYGMESDIAACLAAGFNEHLTKPVDFDRLCAAIGRLPQRSAVSEEPRGNSSSQLIDSPDLTSEMSAPSSALAAALNTPPMPLTSKDPARLPVDIHN